jgi:hypothetical protein
MNALYATLLLILTYHKFQQMQIRAWTVQYSKCKGREVQTERFGFKKKWEKRRRFAGRCACTTTAVPASILHHRWGE